MVWCLVHVTRHAISIFVPCSFHFCADMFWWYVFVDKEYLIGTVPVIQLRLRICRGSFFVQMCCIENIYHISFLRPNCGYRIALCTFFVANMNVSRYILILDMSVVARSNMGRRATFNYAGKSDTKLARFSSFAVQRSWSVCG
jgi:hypothetical protein